MQRQPRTISTKRQSYSDPQKTIELHKTWNPFRSIFAAAAGALGFNKPKGGRVGLDGFVLANPSSTLADYQRVRALAVSRSANPQPQIKPAVTVEDRAWFEMVQGATITQATEIKSGPQGPRATPTPRTDQKTEGELLEAVINNARRCFGCLNVFGGFIWIPEFDDFERMTIEHGHITKARYLGGLKEDDYPVCPTCQRIQGKGPGMPVTTFQQRVAGTFAERGYLYLPRPLVLDFVRFHGTQNSLVP